MTIKQGELDPQQTNASKTYSTMVSTQEILLEYVCPGLGVLIGNCMFFAPYGDLKLALQDGNLGNLNPTPWAFMLGNCFGWVLYGMLIQNLWIFAGNAPGFILSVWLNLGAVKLLQQGHYSTALRTSMITYLQEREESAAISITSRSVVKEESSNSYDDDPPISTPSSAVTDWASIVWNVTSQTTPAPTPHENLILAMVVLWMVIVSIIAFATTLPFDTTTFIVGVCNNIILVFFYGAPLSTIWTILKDRNTASLHIPTMILNTLNGTFWMIYGIAVMDYFLILPNGLGACLGCIQIVLCFMFPRTATTTTTTTTSNNNIDNAAATARGEANSDGASTDDTTPILETFPGAIPPTTPEEAENGKNKETYNEVSILSA